MARHSNLLDRDKTALIVVDMQERFAPIIPEFAEIERNILILVKSCKILGLPVFYTEQYPKGLGRTTDVVRQELGDLAPIEKMRFSIAEEAELKTALEQLGITHIILVGIETHVCMLQSALDFLHLGYTVHLVFDATGSRKQINRDIAVERMRQQGVTVSVTESSIFELAEISGTNEFKQLSQLIK